MDVITAAGERWDGAQDTAAVLAEVASSPFQFLWTVNVISFPYKKRRNTHRRRWNGQLYITNCISKWQVQIPVRAWGLNCYLIIHLRPGKGNGQFLSSSDLCQGQEEIFRLSVGCFITADKVFETEDSRRKKNFRRRKGILGSNVQILSGWCWQAIGRAEVQGACAWGGRGLSLWLRHWDWHLHVSAEYSDWRACLSLSHALPGYK